jgi:hypothetical protein
MKEDSDIDIWTLEELKQKLHELNTVDEYTEKARIKAIAYLISTLAEEYCNIDRPLYDNATHLGTMKYGTRKEIMILVNKIRKGLQGLIDYIEE